ncbi:cell wall metabolism sensor histidine kinase WalK [Exiguobacterium flavidum]|uniref:cell wall metabolism sensor histidine kinase WalK n=1 Tax=Exiguobacterium flavidum TaxID=2184695 RepID=UPI0038BD973F
MKGTNFFKSIQWKLVVIYALLILVAMQVIGVYFVRSLDKQYVTNFSKSVEDRAGLVAYNVGKEFDKAGDDEASKRQLALSLDQLLSEFSNSATSRNDILEVQIIDSDSVIRATSDEGNRGAIGQRATNSLVKKAFATSSSKSDTVLDPTTDERIRVFAVPVTSEQRDATIGMIYVRASMESIYSQMEQVTRILATGTIIALVITSILGVLLSRTITRPISDMRRQAIEMRKGNFSRKVKVYSDDEIGQLARSFNELTDELLEANATTEAERRKLTSVLENMTDGVIATDRTLRVILMNDQAKDIVGIEEESTGTNLKELLGLGDDFMIPDDGTMPPRLLDFSSDEELFLVRAFFSPVKKHSGPVTGMIVVLHDVTEQEQVEQDRREFVANVSHELRTPLTTMRSYLEALAEGAYQDEELAPRFLETTQNETERMIRLVNDLLQLSKMDSKEYKMNKVRFDYIQFLSDIIDRHDMTKPEKIRFRRKIMKRKVYVRADQDKMIQVVDNILTNAIKYSPEGGTITVRTMLRAKRIVISIKDEGVGIPKANLQKIFERFYRVDKARARKIGGTGLGLSIAKDVVAAHSGDIWAESEWGRGTTIYFTLPYEAIEEVDE